MWRALLLSMLLCVIGAPVDIEVSAAFAGQPPLTSVARQLAREMRERGEPLGEIHLAVAALYARQGDERGVLRHLRSARARHISNSRIDLVLATLYRLQGRYDAAISTLVRVLVNHRAQPHALVQLWKTLYESQLRGAVIKTDVVAIRDQLAGYGLHFPASFKLTTDAASRSRRITAAGYNALLARRPAFASQLFQAAIDAMPSNARAHRGLGIARARQEDFARAAGAYLLYLDLAPDAADAAAIDRELIRYFKRRRDAN